MPTSSSTKKASAEPSTSKKGDMTPIRISSRVRKEKFSVKELFGGTRDKDVSSDEEPPKPTPKRKIEKNPSSISKASSDKDTKVQVVRVEVVKPGLSKQMSKSQSDGSSPKPGTSKASALSKSAVTSSAKVSTVSGKTVVAVSPKPTSSKSNVTAMSKTSTQVKPVVATSFKSSAGASKSSLISGKSVVSAKSNMPGSPKANLSIPPKTSLLKKQHESSNTIGNAPLSSTKDEKDPKVNSPKAKMKSLNKDDDKFDALKLDNIKLEPLFNEDNIDTVLENPSSLGLDIVVTKLSESDQKEHLESKKSKNVVTIAKVTGSAPVSKPIKVVPMKPSDKIPEIDQPLDDNKISKEFKGSGVVITPKLDKNSKSTLLDKKICTKVQSRPPSTNKVSSLNQIKEVKVNKSLSSDVVVVTQTIDNKGTISTKVVEKKRDINLLDPKVKSKLSISDLDLDKSRDQFDPSFSDKIKVKEHQRQRAVKRSIMDISDYKSNGLRNVKVRSVEADSSSNEVDIKRAKVVEEIFGESEETLQEEIRKPPYQFDRYFTTSESIIEHNESLDSEGSMEETEATYLSHFYEKDSHNNNYKRRKMSDPYSEGYTIYDLMYDVNCEFPSWNLHVMQDTASFLICQVTRSQHGLPSMSKMIELESDFSSAKVYINKILHREFCGSYNTYESIKELISTVQQF